MSAEGNDQRDWTAHLSESWNAYQGCSNFLEQTMRVAVALHTLGQRFRLRCLLARLRALKTGWQRNVACRCGGRTRQIVGMQGEEGQCSQCRP